MDIKTDINNNWHKLQIGYDTISDALNWSDSARKLHEQSINLSHSKAFTGVISALVDNRSTSLDSYKMSRYFSQCLEYSPEYNLRKFINYINDIINRLRSQKRIKYYIRLQESVKYLLNSSELAAFIEVSSEFKLNKDKGTILAKDIINKVSENTNINIRGV